MPSRPNSSRWRQRCARSRAAPRTRATRAAAEITLRRASSAGSSASAAARRRPSSFRRPRCRPTSAAAASSAARCAARPGVIRAVRPERASGRRSSSTVRSGRRCVQRSPAGPAPARRMLHSAKQPGFVQAGRRRSRPGQAWSAGSAGDAAREALHARPDDAGAEYVGPSVAMAMLRGGEILHPARAGTIPGSRRGGRHDRGHGRAALARPGHAPRRITYALFQSLNSWMHDGDASVHDRPPTGESQRGSTDRP